MAQLGAFLIFGVQEGLLVSANVLLAMRVHGYPVEVDGHVAASDIADNNGAVVTFRCEAVGRSGHPVMIGNNGLDSAVRRELHQGHAAGQGAAPPVQRRCGDGELTFVIPSR